jgi:hypothetical protein
MGSNSASIERRQQRGEENRKVKQSEEGTMSHRILLLRFSIGTALLAIMSGAIIRNGLSASNGWIPISVLFFILSYFALLIRSALTDIDARLKKIEGQKAAE